MTEPCRFPPPLTEQHRTTNEKNRYYSPSMLTSRLVMMFVRNHHAEKCCVHRFLWQEREHVTFSVYLSSLNRYGYVGRNFSSVFWSSSIELWTEQSLPGPQDMKRKSMENHWMVSIVASSLFLLTKALDGFVYLENILGEYLPWLYSDMLSIYLYIYTFYSYKCCEYWKNRIQYIWSTAWWVVSAGVRGRKPNQNVGSNGLCLPLFAAQHWARLFPLCAVLFCNKVTYASFGISWFCCCIWMYSLLLPGYDA